jgi:hypothetical protein
LLSEVFAYKAPEMLLPSTLLMNVFLTIVFNVMNQVWEIQSLAIAAEGVAIGQRSAHVFGMNVVELQVSAKEEETLCLHRLLQVM